MWQEVPIEKELEKALVEEFGESQGKTPVRHKYSIIRTLMDNTTFGIQSLEEARRLETLLNRYASATTRSGGLIAPKNYLTTVFSYSQNHGADGRLFNAVVDLEFTYLFMRRDVRASAGMWNERFSPKHPQVDSILHDFHKFSGKMDILYSLNSFAFRCRAFWDKYLGLLILLYDEEKYDRYFKGQSRKKAFQKIARIWTDLSPHFRTCLAETLDNLRSQSGIKTNLVTESTIEDIPFPSPFIEILLNLIEGLDSIRTAEAHGTGVLRKWSLSTLPLDKTRDFGLIDHWNMANRFMKALQKTVLDRAAAEGSS